MKTEQWCSRCQSRQAMEWQQDFRFGHDAESALCPRCGGIWGVRSRRQSAPRDAALPQPVEEHTENADAAPNVTPSPPIGREGRPAGGR
jgi:hypothetical protein